MELLIRACKCSNLARVQGKTVETHRKEVYCGLLNTDPVQGRVAWKILEEEIHICIYPVVGHLQRHDME